MPLQQTIPTLLSNENATEIALFRLVEPDIRFPVQQNGVRSGSEPNVKYSTGPGTGKHNSYRNDEPVSKKRTGNMP